MLKILVSMLVFTSASLVHADTGTTFGDLFYMPNSSEYLFSADSSLSKGEYVVNSNNSAGTHTDIYNYKKKVVKTDFKLGYSVSDYLLVGTGIGFVYRDHLENLDRRGVAGQLRVADGEVKNSASFTDPSVFARFRAMNMKDNGFVLDITANVLVDLDWTKMYKAKRGAVNGTAVTVGNAKKGGSEVAIGAEAGKNFGVFEAKLYGNYIYGAKAKTHRQAVDNTSVHNAPGNAAYNQEDTHEFNLGVSTLTHLYTRWLWGVGADLYMHDEVVDGGVLESGTRLEETTDDYKTVELNTEIRFVYTRDMYLSLGYAYGINDDRSTTFKSDGVMTQRNDILDDKTVHTGTFSLVAKF